MYKRLYIIGNGFDLHYGLKTSLREFGSYVRLRDEALADSLELLFGGDLWGCFEEALRWLSPDDVVGDRFGLLVGIDRSSNGFDEAELAAWSYQLEAMQEALDWRKIIALLADWISQVSIPQLENDGVIEDDELTCYMTFNYTNTLEKAFGVDARRVLHIHGLAGDKIIAGHAGQASAKGRELHRADFNYHEEWEVEKHRQNFLKSSVKPVFRIIAKNEGFFGALSDVEEVIVAGFGFWEVDKPYISRICDALPERSNWKVYSHSVDDRKRALASIPDSRRVSFKNWPS